MEFSNERDRLNQVFVNVYAYCVFGVVCNLGFIYLLWNQQVLLHNYSFLIGMCDQDNLCITNLFIVAIFNSVSDIFPSSVLCGYVGYAG